MTPDTSPGPQFPNRREGARLPGLLWAKAYGQWSAKKVSSQGKLLRGGGIAEA